MQGVDPSVIEALALGRIDDAGVPESERELLRFAATVTRNAHRIGPGDVERLRQAGWSEDQIAEAVYVTALFAFFNRVADAFGLQDEGYAGGFARLLEPGEDGSGPGRG